MLISTVRRLGGKETGQAMSHYIVPRGLFDVVCQELLEDGFTITWADWAGSSAKKPVKNTRTKFVCPGCDLSCGECEELMEAQDA